MGRSKTQTECETEAIAVGALFTSIYSGRSDDLHDYECQKCNTMFRKRPYSIHQGIGCPDCGHEKGRHNRRISQLDCEKAAHEMNVRFTSIYSGHCSDLHEYECLVCFNTFPSRPRDIKRKHGCPKCAINRRIVYKNETCRRIARVLRDRMSKAIKNKYTKKSSAVKDLGMSIEEFYIHFQKLFQPGMTWENHGKVWHIDHIKPLALFNLEIEEEQKKAVHYSNLQPLWAKDNLSKGPRMPKLT